MCRFVVYVSPSHPILLADLLTRPPHSIVKQSFASEERKASEVLPPSINADGFGVGWYSKNHDPQKSPCLFTSVLPAWSNKNLHRLCEIISSPLIFAHVRAASAGSDISETNCHPFVEGRYIFMHNGGIGMFREARRDILMELRKDICSRIHGSTDSEHAFMLFLNYLPKNSLQSDKYEDADVLLTAFKNMIIKLIDIQKKLNKKTTSLLNFSVSDGRTTLVSRLIVHTESNNDDEKNEKNEHNQKTEKSYNDNSQKLSQPASLYFSTGSHFVKCNDGEYRMRHLNMNEDVVIVASERLSKVREDWVEVPANHILLISHKTNILLFPVNVEKELKKIDKSKKKHKSEKK